MENQDYVYWDDWDDKTGDLTDKEIKGELDG